MVLSHCSSSISSSKLQSSLCDRLPISWCPHRRTSVPCLSSSSNRSSASSYCRHPNNSKPWSRRQIRNQILVPGVGGGGEGATTVLKEIETTSSTSESGKDDTYTLPRIDKNGRFCSPRAARELALYSNFKLCVSCFIQYSLFDILFLFPE